ncbi:MAG: TetR/AcrR family transcriptional regulator [Pseudomonadota bacterium]
MGRTRQNDKRNRLIQAADQLIREKNYVSTTLAHIAEAASVPLGNVYYYFKTKDEILDCVIQYRAEALTTFLDSLSTLPPGVARLLALVRHYTDSGEQVARFGCEIGNLCHELSKNSGQHAEKASVLLTQLIDWCQKQFESMNTSPEDALVMATYFVAGLQGAQLMTLTFKDPTYLQRQSANLNRWLQAALETA